MFIESLEPPCDLISRFYGRAPTLAFEVYVSCLFAEFQLFYLNCLSLQHCLYVFCVVKFWADVYIDIFILFSVSNNSADLSIVCRCCRPTRGGWVIYLSSPPFPPFLNIFLNCIPQSTFPNLHTYLNLHLELLSSIFLSC